MEFGSHFENGFNRPAYEAVKLDFLTIVNTVTHRALSGLKLFFVLRVTFSISMEMILRFCSNSLALLASIIF